jgi:hypothetical protein
MFKINYIISLATILVLVAIFFIFNAEQSRYQLVGTNRPDSSGLFVFDSKDKNLNYCNEKNCNLLSIINPMFNNQPLVNSCGFNNFIPQSVYNFGSNNPQPNIQPQIANQIGNPYYNQMQQNPAGFYGQPQAMFAQSTNPVPDGMKQMVDANGKPLPITQTRTPQICNDTSCVNPTPSQQQTNQPNDQSACNEYKRQADEYKKKYDEYKEKLKNVLTDKINALEQNSQGANDNSASPAPEESSDDQNNSAGGDDQAGGDSGDGSNSDADQNSDQGDGASGDSQGDGSADAGGGSQDDSGDSQDGAGGDDSANQDG